MRIISKLLRTSLFGALVFAPAAATADSKLEAGFTVGGHVFSSNGELGVSDKMDGASPQSSAMFGGRVGYAFLPQFIAELELVMIPTVDDDESRGAAVFGGRGHVRYQPFGDTLMGGKLHPFLLAGYGFMAVRTDSMQLENDADQSYDWGLGTHYALTRSMDLRLDARHILVPDRSNNGATSNFEIAAGLTWRFGAGRSGGSGVERSEPGTAGVELAATPPAPTPATPAAPAPAKPAAASPAPATVTTSPAPAAASSAEGPNDNDHDGVFTPQDACPQEREDADGFGDGDGCPDPDNDGDGILDGADRCAGDAETINGYSDTDGCPDAQHPDLAAMPFARDSSNFTAEAAALLDKTFQVLQANPSFRVELGGHSSSDEGSRTLSLRRAEAVKDYLVRRGVSEGRLRVLGYRSEQPISSDKSSAGRAKNRRVELKLLPLQPTAK